MPDVSSTPTLQTVLNRLANVKGPSTKARADMASAIYVLCRELGRQPGEVRVSQVEGLGSGLNAVRMNVGQRRVTNIRSMVRRAISLTCVELPKRRLDLRLSPIWAGLVTLVKDKGDRIVLKRLFRIFQLQGVEPSSLTPEAFEHVRDYLRATGASMPDAMYRRIVLAWNRLNALLHSYRT